MARRVMFGIIGTVFAGMVGVVAFGAYNIFTRMDGGGGSASSPQNAAAPANQSVSLKEVSETATDFLTAWASGDITRAARLTDSPQTATDALRGFMTGGHITKMDITPGTPSATSMPYTALAHVRYQGQESLLQYGSSLTVSRNPSGEPSVKWVPSALYPGLTDGDTIVTGQATAPDLNVVDRHNVTMTARKFPSLARIFDDFTAKYGNQLSGGTPSIRTYVKRADGSEGKTLITLHQGKGKRLATTLDSKLQAAAEKAVAGKATSGVVALDTRTGGILAIAYSPATGTDNALQDREAPGSTFKIVTAAALMEGGLTPDSPAPCFNGKNYKYGRIYHNEGGLHDNANATLRWDFAVSCNTGFILQAGHLPGGGLLHAAPDFGLTEPWNIGTPTPDDQPKMPTLSSQDELTSEMIGQGQLEMNPLIMASVAATAASGTFHQPLIVDRGLIQNRIAASHSLPSGISTNLRAMMHDAIAYGTASTVMHGFGSDAGAKTGSAELDGAPTTNGWFTAYDGHVAAAALVQAGGHGNSSAGPIVTAVLSAQ